MLHRMRLRVVASIVVVVLAVTVGGLVSSPARADNGSSDWGSSGLGSSDLLSPTSLFLWQSPPTRYIVVLGAKMGTFGQTPTILNERLDTGAAWPGRIRSIGSSSPAAIPGGCRCRRRSS